MRIGAFRIEYVPLVDLLQGPFCWSVAIHMSSALIVSLWFIFPSPLTCNKCSLFVMQGLAFRV
jgi:hypothetical protein